MLLVVAYAGMGGNAGGGGDGGDGGGSGGMNGGEGGEGGKGGARRDVSVQVASRPQIGRSAPTVGFITVWSAQRGRASTGSPTPSSSGVDCSRREAGCCATLSDCSWRSAIRRPSTIGGGGKAQLHIASLVPP